MPAVGGSGSATWAGIAPAMPIVLATITQCGRDACVAPTEAGHLCIRVLHSSHLLKQRQMSRLASSTPRSLLRAVATRASLLQKQGGAAYSRLEQGGCVRMGRARAGSWKSRCHVRSSGFANLVFRGFLHDFLSERWIWRRDFPLKCLRSGTPLQLLKTTGRIFRAETAHLHLADSAFPTNRGCFV